MKRRVIALLILLIGVLLIAAQCPFIPDPIPPDPDPNPNPAPGATLFFDNFNDGFDYDYWSVSPGWREANGVVGPDDGHWAYAYVVVGTAWDDYIIEVDLYMDSSTSGALVYLRCQENLQNYVQVSGFHNYLYWAKVIDGEVTDSETVDVGFFQGHQRLKIIADGNQFRVYVDDLLRLSFTVDGLSHGMPAIGGNRYTWGVYFDNFRVTALD